MQALLLQDWVTVGGTAAVSSIVQDQVGWLDMTPFQDVTFWLDVRDANGGGGTLTVAYQTSPVEDEGYFFNMVSPVTMTAGSSPTRSLGLLNGASVAVARWLRWKVSQSGAAANWDATFRIWVAANAPGA